MRPWKRNAVSVTQDAINAGADSSAIPADFANASPFHQRTKGRDPVRATVLAVAAIALLTFPGSMIAVLTMHAPKP